MDLIRTSSNPNPNFPILDNICPVCYGHIITDSFSGELLCSRCGVVLMDRMEVAHLELDSPDSDAENMHRKGFQSSFLIADTGLSTLMGRQNKKSWAAAESIENAGNSIPINNDAGGGVSVNPSPFSSGINMDRLRRLNSISVSDLSVSRNLKRAIWDISRICNLLALPHTVAEASCYYYRKCAQKDLIKGRSRAGFVTGSIYLACKQRMIPRTMEEICNIALVERPFAVHCYKIMVDAMGIQVPPVTDPKRNISKISARAMLGEKVSMRAREILVSVNDSSIISGKNPVVVAAAALYMACVENGIQITKSMIADAAQISSLSLRKRVADLIDALGEKGRIIDI